MHRETCAVCFKTNDDATICFNCHQTASCNLRQGIFSPSNLYATPEIGKPQNARPNNNRREHILPSAN